MSELQGNISSAVELQGSINHLKVLLLSAYGIAVKNGFDGTEEEWLASLKGEPGAPGQPGADGKDGTPATDEQVVAAVGEYIVVQDEEPADAKVGTLWVDTDDESAGPSPLTFTGAVNATYDGTQPVTVEIPQGGGSSGGGFDLPLLYEVTTTEEVRWIDTGNHAFEVNRMMIVELWSVCTATNTNDRQINIAAYTEKDASSGLQPWRNIWGFGDGVQTTENNRWFRAIGFHADGGPWIVNGYVTNPNNDTVVHATNQVKNANADTTIPIRGICIGNNSYNDPTYFGVGTILRIWGC
jgi:hypothetical protein